MSIALAKLSETATTITLGWSPVPGARSYRLTAEKQTKATFAGPNATQAKFSKGSAWYKVEALELLDEGVYPPPPPLPPPSRLYGAHQDLHYNGVDWHAPRLSLMADRGATVSRGLLLWRIAEPTQGNYDWSRSDSIMSLSAQKNMKRVWAIGASPSWANGGGDWNIPQDAGAYATFVSRYADFCGKVAARYKGHAAGSLYEIWNEPNERYFWMPQPPNANQYVQMYKAARAAILAADPNAKVAVGGITGLINGCCILGKDFLTQMKAGGCEVDHIGIHPYDGGPPLSDAVYDGNFTDIERIKAHADSLGWQDAELWCTEWGWNHNTVGLQTQADYVKQSFERLRDVYTYVTISTYFFDIDTTAYPGYGLFYQSGSSGTPKPSAQAFADFIQTV